MLIWFFTPCFRSALFVIGRKATNGLRKYGNEFSNEPAFPMLCLKLLPDDGPRPQHVVIKLFSNIFLFFTFTSDSTSTSSLRRHGEQQTRHRAPDPTLQADYDLCLATSQPTKFLTKLHWGTGNPSIQFQTSQEYDPSVPRVREAASPRINRI